MERDEWLGIDSNDDCMARRGKERDEGRGTKGF